MTLWWQSIHIKSVLLKSKRICNTYMEEGA